MSNGDVRVWDGTVVTKDGLRYLRKAAKQPNIRWYAERGGLLCFFDEKTTSGRTVETKLFASTAQRLQDYDYDNPLGENWKAFTSLDEDLMATVLNFIREGDELRLEFGRGSHSTKATKENGLYGDSVRLLVLRGPKVHRFLLGVSICADNTARAIQST